MSISFHLFCVANDKSILQRDLMRSPEIMRGAVPLTVLWNTAGASAAYFKAMRGVHADLLIFAHQDIYFPNGWFSQVQVECRQLTLLDSNWAVAGLFGVTASAQLAGHLWDSGLGFVCGRPFQHPQQVLSLDEVVLVVRREAGVAFDRNLPSFHLYGTDIVLEGQARGRTSYILDLPVIHNTKPIVRLSAGYASAYQYMVRKWKPILPWPTVILPLTTNPLPLLLRRLRLRYKAVFRASTLHSPLPDPEVKALELGYSRYLGDRTT